MKHGKEKAVYYGKSYLTALLFLLPLLAMFVIFFLIPFISGINMSFYHYNLADPSDTYFVGFENYKYFLFTKEIPVMIDGEPVLGADGEPLMVANNSFYSFWYSLLYTFLFALVIVPVSIFLPLLLASFLKKKPWGYRLWRSLIFIPSIFAVSATGTAFVYLFSNSEDGFINALFNTHIEWLNTPLTAWFVILLLCLYGIGANFIILSAGLENVPKSLYESSLIDGCNSWQKFLYVTLPGIKYQLSVCLFTTLIGYMNLYGQNRVLTMGGPSDFAHPERPGVTHTVIYVIQDYLTGSGKFSLMGRISAVCIVFGLFVAALSSIRLFVDRDKKGGNKHAKEYREYFAKKGTNPAQ